MSAEFDAALDKLLAAPVRHRFSCRHGFATCRCEDRSRWVGARSARGWVEHAVWVTHDTAPGRSRPGLAICGARAPHVFAGPNGGHDWDRVETSKRCIHCVRELSRAANTPARP